MVVSRPSTVSRFVEDGLSIAVRVTPKSSRDAVEGGETRGGVSALKVRVRAVPEDGKANTAVADLIAAFLDTAKRDVAVSSGHTSRDKTVTIIGDAAALQRRLDAKLGATP